MSSCQARSMHNALFPLYYEFQHKPDVNVSYMNNIFFESSVGPVDGRTTLAELRNFLLVKHKSSLGRRWYALFVWF